MWNMEAQKPSFAKPIQSGGTKTAFIGTWDAHPLLTSRRRLDECIGLFSPVEIPGYLRVKQGKLECDSPFELGTLLRILPSGDRGAVRLRFQL